MMNKKFFYPFFFVLFLGIVVIACEKDQKTVEPLPPPPVVSKSFIEEFDTVANLSGKGWIIQNNSDPFGPYAWRQGKYELGGKLGNEVIGFPAFSSVYNQNEFISVDLNAGKNASTLSCWLITPIIPIRNGDEISFYTKSHGDYIDRLQVRANYTTGSAYVGSGATDVGDFSTLLVEINEAMLDNGYPIDWTKYTITITGLPSTMINGRIAFRYYVPDGGPGGTNGDMVGIDRFEFLSK